MSDERKVCQSTMSEEEINMWSIMIAVMKNQNKNYNSVDSLIDDIDTIKLLIQTLK